MMEGETMNEGNSIVYIPVTNLYPHPDNPRKDVGDLTELSASIKANGVMQNLTVIPRWVGGIRQGYTVIIGHRRLAASKLAGLQTVPCIVTEMTDKEQLSTMLLENMQRTDLTVYEQAKAFQQLSLDMDMSVAQITEMSGFSETTVRNRIKIAELSELNNSIFEQACERGATLYDFAELEKLKTDEAKTKCLETIGTPNFKNTLYYEIEKEKTAAILADTREKLNRFATKIEQREIVNGEHVQMQVVKIIGSTTRDEYNAPEDAYTTRYFYEDDGDSLWIFKEVTCSQEEIEKTKAKERRRAIQQADVAELKEITQRHYELRRDFVKNFGAVKTKAVRISEFAAAVMALHATRYYSCATNNKSLSELAGISYDQENWAKLWKNFCMEQPIRALLLSTYWVVDNASQGYWRDSWDVSINGWTNTYGNNADLDSLYYFLEDLGYQTSDEEMQLRRGTHELLNRKEEEN